MRRSAALLDVVRGATASDQAVAAFLAEVDQARLDAMTTHAREAAATGQLAVSEQECRDVLWSTTEGTLWQRIVRQREWTDEPYAAWLGKLWISLLAS